MIQIERPTLIIDEVRVRRNISKMAEKVKRSGAIFRPHFKTHQSIEVGNWCRDYGVERITTSSVSMARYFAGAGWEDILIAFPYNPYECHYLDELSKKVKLSILVESEDALDHAIKNISGSFSYYVKLDVGTHRTGLQFQDIDLIQKLLKPRENRYQPVGLLFHAGHTYQSRSKAEVLKALDAIISIVQEIQSGLDTPTFLSHGDTPTCAVADDLSTFDEIRCGNFVYYDMMQVQIGSCDMDDVGVAMAVPIVATHHDRNEVLAYGGAVHFSKDHLMTEDGTFFGQVVKFTDSSWEPVEETILKKVSQEHGIISGPEKIISKINFGDILGVLPVHSCLTADLTRDQKTLSGETINTY